MRIAITGATGFIGSELVTQLRSLGHDTVALQRSAPSSGTDWMRYALGERPDLHGFDVLIHTAYDFRAHESNVTGSIALFDQARACGVPHSLFLSSLSAFDGCRSQYGRGKLAVERHVTSMGGVSVRLGFVYDRTNRGLSGSLRKVAGMLPVIPVPGRGDQPLYLLPIAGLGGALLDRAMQCEPGTVARLAETRATTMADLLRQFSRDAGKNVILVPVPWRLMWAGLRTLEALGVGLRFRSDSLVSLVNQATYDGV